MMLAAQHLLRTRNEQKGTVFLLRRGAGTQRPRFEHIPEFQNRHFLFRINRRRPTLESRSRVNQLELAADLGLTDRRVRQLSSEHVLPEPHFEDGLFDLALCRERYSLYKNGSDREWEAFYSDLEADAVKTKKLFERAVSDAGTAEDVRAASLAVQATTDALHFATACRSKSCAEKDMFHAIWKHDADEAIGGLAYRAAVIMGADRIADDDGTAIAMLPRTGSDSSKRPPVGRAARGH